MTTLIFLLIMIVIVFVLSLIIIAMGVKEFNKQDSNIFKRLDSLEDNEKK